jgi:hypothetical protein
MSYLAIVVSARQKSNVQTCQYQLHHHAMPNAIEQAETPHGQFSHCLDVLGSEKPTFGRIQLESHQLHVA